MSNYTTKVGDYTYTLPKIENIPQELKDINRWVTWQAVLRPGDTKPTKIPYDAKYPNVKAKSNSPESWASFEEAVTSFEEGDRTGVGIVLNGDGLVGVDLDNCVVNRKINPEAQAILRQLNPQYVEFSPSGNGIRALGYADNLPKGINGTLNGVQIEMYSTGRYLTLTGDVVKNVGIWSMPGFNKVAEQITPTTQQLLAPTNLEGQCYIDLNRNNYLFHYASKLRRNIHDLNIILNAVMAENMRVCRPPLAENEIRATIMQTMAKYQPVEFEAPQTPQQAFQVDPDTGEVIFKEPEPISLLDNAAIHKTTSLQAPQWVIDGIIPNGVGVIAGVGGVGKTTALMPLVATVAGFDDHLSNITVKIQRQVVYITEDPVQAQKAIYAIKKWRKSGKDIQTIEDFVHLYNSKQYKINELKTLIEECIERYSMEFRGIMFPPLIVFDTAAANIAVDNENDNAEIARYMTMFKQLWATKHVPIWLVNHLAKSANGLSIDELDTHSARGASAWRDNSNWTANLAIAQGSNDRILQMLKVREELEFNEIEFSSIVHDEVVKDIFGDDVVVKYRYCTAARSSKNMRIHEKIKGLEEAILEAIKTTSYPSANDICDLVTGSGAEIKRTIKGLVEQGKLVYLPLPDAEKAPGKSKYLSGSL